MKNENVKGCLVILYSTNSLFVHYEVIERDDTTGFTRSINIPSGDYNVSLFSLDKNGLPFTRTAHLPKSISLSAADIERESNQDDSKYTMDGC